MDERSVWCSECGRTGRVPVVPLQEQVRDWGPPEEYGWRVLLVCVLCNRTPGARVRPVLCELLARWPTPADLIRSDEAALEELLRPLGLVKRARTLVMMTRDWDSARRLAADGVEVPAVSHWWGCGRYAQDAVAIFVDGRTDVEPADRVLREWVLARRKRVSSPALRDGVHIQVCQSNQLLKGDPDMATKKQTKQDEPIADAPVVEDDAPQAEQAEAETPKRETAWTLLIGTGLPRVGTQTAGKALGDAGIPQDAEATDEQRQRARDFVEGKAAGGLAGRALALWVLTGDSRGNGEVKAADARKAAEAREAGEAKQPTIGVVVGGDAKPRSKYPVEVSQGPKLARIARGADYAGPGAKQFALVRDAVGADADAKAILAAAGVKSERALLALADGSASREDLKALHPLAEKIAPMADKKVTVWCKGRNLASMVYAMLVQAKGPKAVDDLLAKAGK
jgi:methyl-CpG-binding domain protein 4